MIVFGKSNLIRNGLESIKGEELKEIDKAQFHYFVKVRLVYPLILETDMMAEFVLPPSR